MSKYTVGEILGLYEAIPETETQKRLCKNINLKFKAFSVGNKEGQVAIFPVDEIGVKKAKEHANKLCDLLNSET